jgi:polysaccharide export outer membrane protein
VLFLLNGCASTTKSALQVESYQGESPMYIIGPGDNVNVFVWGNSELSRSVPVRPDGRITTPLVEDLVAVGTTPSELARKIEKRLSKYVKNPVVTVYVSGFVGRFSEQIRVVGEAASPKALQYRDQMSVLDVMIEVGGLTQFAAGDRATIIRTVDGKQQQFRVQLDTLIKDGNIAANVYMSPGDILIIPEAWF